MTETISIDLCNNFVWGGSCLCIEWGVNQDMDALDIDLMQELTLWRGPTILSIEIGLMNRWLA